jgi:hypothetical protein
MTQSITYEDILREAFLEKIVNHKQLQLETSKSDIPPPGMYKIPNQPEGSYYAVFDGNWYYFFTEQLTDPSFPGDTQFYEEHLSHKKITNTAEIKKLNRKAKWVRKFSASELSGLAKITPKDNTLTYIDTDGVETVRKDLVMPTVVIRRINLEKYAKIIYDAKGIIDDPYSVFAAISNVSDSRQYWALNKTFMNQVDPKKRTIVEYLRSFLSTSDLCRVAWLLKDILNTNDYFVLKQLNTYAELKKVATWVYRNMPNSIKNHLNSKLDTQFDAELKAMEITFPGGIGLLPAEVGLALYGTGPVNLRPDTYASQVQYLKGWVPDAARMVWEYFHSPKLYLNEFKEDLKTIDWRDAMAVIGAGVGQATYWTWDETVQELRNLAYSPGGMVGTIVLDVFPETAWIPKIAFGVLLADDIYKLTTGTGNDETVLHLVFDGIGVFHTEIAALLSKILRPLLRGIIAIAGAGFKMSSPVVKYLIQFVRSASNPIIETLKKIVGGSKLVSKIIQTFKDGLKLIKDTIKDMPFLNNAISAINKAIANIELYWMGMIKPFLDTLSKVIKAVKDFPGQSVEYIMQKLGFRPGAVPVKAVKAGVKSAPAIYGIHWALQTYNKWKSEYDLEQLNQKQQTAFIKANIDILKEHVIGVPNVKRLESWKYDETTEELKSFGIWNNYEEQMSDAEGNIIPMEMVLYDTLKVDGESATYVKVKMPLDPNLEKIEEVYIKRSEIDQVNIKPLKDIK